ncbi:glycosyltransferase [Paenibacillus sp. CC-CFT747]|nr:glycosyltransferase [Paenibacillus sp. CC-CFT747]
MARAAAASGVSIVVCTNRPEFFGNILANYRNQRYRKKELILILNKDSMKLDLYRAVTRRYEDVRVYQVPEKLSLGQCLNCGIAKAQYPLIAKFDDDDYYSPYYLKEQVKALYRTKSDVVGKHACLVYLAAAKRLLLRSPEEKDRVSLLVQGGTILFRRRVLTRVRFADRSIGEDVRFLIDCRKKGYKTYATSPYNYVYMRRKNKQSHTWRVDDNFYRKGSLALAVTDNYERFADRAVR